jgi:hypothetical protein
MIDARRSLYPHLRCEVGECSSHLFKRNNKWLVGRVLSIDTQKQILTVQVGNGTPIEIHQSEVRPPF